MMIMINGNNDNNSNSNSNDNDNHYAADRSEHAEVRPIGVQHTPVAATRTHCSLLALARGLPLVGRQLLELAAPAGKDEYTAWLQVGAPQSDVARPAGRCPPQRVGVRDSPRAVVRLMRICARASKRARLGRGCGV
jgi:hypothetical protein